MPLSVENLFASYDSSDVLLGVSFSVDAPCVVGLIGPNGSGKSTILRCLAGGEVQARGTARWNGVDLLSLPARERARRVALVPQTESILFDFTVREIVLMGQSPYETGWNDSERAQKAADVAMDQADVSSLADRRCHALSGGEWQRVLLARALAQQCDLILMDEPIAHADPAHHLAAANLARGLAAAGKTVLIASHDLVWVSRFTDRCVLIRSGRCAAANGTRELLESTALDDAFGVRFARIDTEFGLLIQPVL